MPLSVTVGDPRVIDTMMAYEVLQVFQWHIWKLPKATVVNTKILTGTVASVMNFFNWGV